jgi:nitrite reductase (NO-forming)
MQSEFYTETSPEDKNLLEFSYQRGLDENPSHIVFNGKVNQLIDNPLVCNQGDKVRLYVGKYNCPLIIV